MIGADRIADGDPLYGGFPSDNEHGDTYGPVDYARLRAVRAAAAVERRWDDLPAAHAAAIVVRPADASALLWLLGRRVGGRTLGIALAYAWAAFPFTLYALEHERQRRARAAARAARAARGVERAGARRARGARAG